jgi:hypothetical protein
VSRSAATASRAIPEATRVASFHVESEDSADPIVIVLVSEGDPPEEATYVQLPGAGNATSAS